MTKRSSCANSTRWRLVVAASSKSKRFLLLRIQWQKHRLYLSPNRPSCSTTFRQRPAPSRCPDPNHPHRFSRCSPKEQQSSQNQSSKTTTWKTLYYESYTDKGYSPSRRLWSTIPNKWAAVSQNCKTQSHTCSSIVDNTRPLTRSGGGARILVRSSS